MANWINPQKRIGSVGKLRTAATVKLAKRRAKSKVARTSRKRNRRK